jgi:hypothetical protein
LRLAGVFDIVAVLVVLDGRRESGAQQGGAVRRTLLFATVAFAIATAMPSTASAQERKGFWGNFGLGQGSIGVSAQTFAGTPFQEDRDAGFVGEIGLGWALNQQLLVGLEVKAMFATLAGDVATLDISNVSATLTYYPRPASNFFVRGGVGGSFLDLTFDAPEVSLAVEAGQGIGFSAGTGYDVYLGRGFSLTPAVGFWYGRPGDLRVGGQTFLRNWRHNVIDVTLSIKFN